MAKNIRNIAASVHDRLLKLARKTSRPFNELLRLFAIDAAIFDASFGKDEIRQVHWRDFLRKSRLRDVPEDFADVMAGIRMFLEPPVRSLASGRKFHGAWNAKGADAAYLSFPIPKAFPMTPPRR